MLTEMGRRVCDKVGEVVGVLNEVEVRRREVMERNNAVFEHENAFLRGEINGLEAWVHEMED